MSKDLIELGFCHKPHGIKGAFLFTLHNMEDSVLEKGKVVTLIPYSEKSSLPPKGEEYTIASISFGNKVIVTLEGVTDRNQVEDLVPFTIFFPRSEFPELEGDEIYTSDLIDMKVVNEEFEKIGKVSNTYDNGANLILVVELDKGSSVELPFVSEFFPKIDLKSREIMMVEAEIIE